MRALTAGTNGARVAHQAAGAARNTTAKAAIVRTRRRGIASIVAFHLLELCQPSLRDDAANLMMPPLELMHLPVSWPLRSGQNLWFYVSSGSAAPICSVDLQTFDKPSQRPYCDCVGWHPANL
jgi:hypothetical protein